MTEVDNASYDKSKHKMGALKLKFFLWYFVNIIFFINPLNPFSFLKIRFLKLFGAKIGYGVLLKPGINIKYPWKLEIGNHSWIGERVWIDNVEPVRIEDHTCLSQGCLILTGNHNYKKKSFDLLAKKIIIKKGAWIGANAVVTAGVICETHSILSVGSIATSNLSAYGIYQGNPAVCVRQRIISK